MVLSCLDLKGRSVSYRLPRGCKRVRCPDVQVALTDVFLKVLFEGSPLQRFDAIAQLGAVQRGILFPSRCVCDADHSKLAANLLRCAKGLSPAARDLGERAEYNLAEWIALAAIQGDTPEETEALQMRALRVAAFGGNPPSESCDSPDGEWPAESAA